MGGWLLLKLLRFHVSLERGWQKILVLQNSDHNEEKFSKLKNRAPTRW